MKLVRFEAHGETAYGAVEGGLVKQLAASPFESCEVTDHAHSLSEVKILAPVVPRKIVAIGLNYKSHLGDTPAPEVPEPFLKSSSAVIAHEEDIVIPREAIEGSLNVQEEAELSVVIGKECRRATRDDALSYVLGYTCGNDVSARPWQYNDLSWWRGKSSDTFAPLGPFIVTGLDPSNLALTARVNGETVQDATTADLIHDVPSIIEFVSRTVTLEPGDVIMTGTPGQPVDIHPGDTVEIEIEGVGLLRNRVKAEDAG